MTASRVVEVMLSKRQTQRDECPGYQLGVRSDTGLSGHAELAFAQTPELMEAVEALAPLVLGRSSHDREAIWHAIAGAAADWDDSPDAAASLLSAFDIALWDLAGQELGVPTTTLMGGRTRPRTEICVDCGDCAEETSIQSAKAAVATGVRMVSFSVDPTISTEVDRFRRARRLLGTEVMLIARVSPSPATTEAAIELGQSLDRADPFWVSGLLRDGQWKELAQVRKGIAAPTAAGQATIGVQRFRRALDAGCCDLLIPTLSYCGGITGALKLADLVGLYGVRMALAPCVSLMTALVSACVSVSRSHLSPLWVTDAALAEMGLSTPEALKDGFVLACDLPGLGYPAGWTARTEPLVSFSS